MVDACAAHDETQGTRSGVSAPGIAEVSGVMRPGLPREALGLLTWASASDRGWVRENPRTCDHTFWVLRVLRSIDTASCVARESYRGHCGGTQPCRCLCRGFSQITITRPCRRITLHFSQILLTLG